MNKYKGIKMTLNQQRKMKVIFIRYMKITLCTSDREILKDHLINILLKQTINKNDFNICAEFLPYFYSEIAKSLGVEVKNLRKLFNGNTSYGLEFFVCLLESRYLEITKNLKIWNKPYSL